MPSVAIRELETTPWPLVLDIMELRAYRDAKQALDNAKDKEQLPNSPMVDEVWKIQLEIARRVKSKREG